VPDVICIAAPLSPQIQREFQTKPLRLTYEELSHFLNELITLADTANRAEEDTQRRYPRIVRLSIAAGEDTMKLTELKSLPQLRGLAPVAYGIRFSYEAYGNPISDITIDLGDFTRRVTIAGTDAAQIQAIPSYTRQRLDSYTTWFGGVLLRMLSGTTLLVIAILLAVGGLSIYFRGKLVPAQKTIGVLLIASVVLLPWEAWLPGTAVYAGSASWLDRNINVISLLGVILTVAIPAIIAIFQSLEKHKDTRQS